MTANDSLNVLSEANKKTISDYFLRLGFLPEIADIYTALISHGPLTISELARFSKVERTRIYRIINELKQSSLVEVETHVRKTIFRAAPLANLHILLSKKEQDLQLLQDELEKINQLMNPNILKIHTTRVQFYQGLDGIKQMAWNQTRSEPGTMNYSILHEPMQVQTQIKFFERWARACNEKNLQFRSIVSDDFMNSLREWYRHNKNEHLGKWNSRYVSPKQFAIGHSTVIYNDVVSYLNWKNGEVFGVEIHNPYIAQTHKQFFELLWEQGRPLGEDPRRNK